MTPARAPVPPLVALPRQRDPLGHVIDVAKNNDGIRPRNSNVSSFGTLPRSALGGSLPNAHQRDGKNLVITQALKAPPQPPSRRSAQAPLQRAPGALDGPHQHLRQCLQLRAGSQRLHLRGRGPRVRAYEVIAAMPAARVSPAASGISSIFAAFSHEPPFIFAR